MHIKRSALLFLQFLRRDAYVHMRNLRLYIVNYTFLYPATFALSFAYLQVNTFFGSGNATLSTVLFSGNILVLIMIITYKETSTLLFDLEANRFIDYQISVLQPRLVIVERIFFTSLLTFAIALPFFPVGKLLLWNYLDTSNASWLQLIIILYLGSLCCSAYHQLAILVLKNSSQITSLWARANNFLMSLGGFFIPWHIQYKYSPLLGNIAYCNPLMYLSEGVRQALVGGPEFLSFTQCALSLFVFSVLFTVLCWHLFKKRVDHI